MKHFLLLAIALSFISGTSFADELFENMNIKQLADREIANIKAKKFENFHLIWGKPSATFQSAIGDAQKKLTQTDSGKSLLGILDQTAKSGTPGNSFSGIMTSCVGSVLMDNLGGWFGSRSCGNIYADRAWVHANLYSGGEYHLLSSFGSLIDFGYHNNGGTFLVSYTPAGYASELTFFWNLTQ